MKYRDNLIPPVDANLDLNYYAGCDDYISRIPDDQRRYAVAFLEHLEKKRPVEPSPHLHGVPLAVATAIRLVLCREFRWSKNGH